MKRITCVIILFVFSGLLNAKPLFIQFHEMIKKSRYIFIGTYLGAKDSVPDETYQKNYYHISSYNLRVEQSLKGDLKPGMFTAKRAKGGAHYFLLTGSKYIVFINDNDEFEWYGKKINEKEPEIDDQSILNLEGFYDFNAYIVSPSTITPGQLKEYLKTGKYTTEITGNLHCFSNTTLQMEAAPVTIDVTYTYRGELPGSTDVKVNGLNWKGYPNKPPIYAPGWRQKIELEYETNLVRPFSILGEIGTAIQDGKMQAYFWVEAPEELTFDELKELLNNEQYGYGYYELEVKTDKNKTYLFELGRETGEIGYLMNYEGKNLEVHRTSCDETTFEIEVKLPDWSDLIFKTDKVDLKKEQFKYTRDPIVRAVRIKPLKVNMYTRKQEGYAEIFIGTCTISYVCTKFAPNENYGK